MVAEDTV